VREVQPDFVFHLAAQPLVRDSYNIPVETFSTNVMGTVHVMDAMRQLNKPCVGIMVTTDKCYENREWLHGYREEDPMGGHDPYSASKGAAEIAIAAYRRSFFNKGPVIIASARAGNVIGGGDWARDRIIPDCIRALTTGASIPVRNKVATRPWQHVLEPLGGYLRLAATLAATQLELASGNSTSQLELATGTAINFGPTLASNRTVAELVQEVVKHWPGEWVDQSDPNAPHEASKLNLTIDKAFHLLGWQPQWGFEKTVAATVEWYRAVHNRADPLQLTRKQIQDYISSSSSGEFE
jgi:CDP-glucose 4,6-dehydratase